MGNQCLICEFGKRCAKDFDQRNQVPRGQSRISQLTSAKSPNLFYQVDLFEGETHIAKDFYFVGAY
jgi:hypothetical protein